MSATPRTKASFHGYFPGVIGMITEAHAVYYYEHWGFDVSFEIQVGRELSEFMAAFQEDRDGFWAVTEGGRFVGSVAIDGTKAGTEGARLRWFIVVPDRQGTGLGKSLLRRAIDFCRRKGFRRVYLWTFEGLDVARALYEGEGFRLSEEHVVDQWGQNLTEQRFELDLPGAERDS